MEKGVLLGMNPEELTGVARALGLKDYAAKQLAHWLYVERVDSIDAMSNLSLVARAALAEAYELGREQPRQASISRDGTAKYLYSVQGPGLKGAGRTVETAVIPEGKRVTACLSSQVGCRMGCCFCATGAQPYGGNLTPAQILNQLFSLPEGQNVTNIVFMGMGEPLDNYPHLTRAIECLCSDWGCAMSPRRITVSTVGASDNLLPFIRQSECHLAVSLHSPFDAQRQELVPASRGMLLRGLMDTIRQGHWYGQRKLSFEYVLIKGVNDSPDHQRATAQLLRGLPALVNIIPFHPHPFAPAALQPPSARSLNAFAEGLTALDVKCTIRLSRGEDISAACGLLSTTQG